MISKSMKPLDMYSLLISRAILLILIINLQYVRAVFDIDNIRYNEGKNQFGILQSNSMMPKYGMCWTKTMDAMVSGCKQLTDVEQSRLALSYLNCFLLLQGKKPYTCSPYEDFKECVTSLTDADSASMATFFTHTQNICYFLEAQVWHENTEKTIHHLSSSSEAVAEQLEKSSFLQEEVIQQQKLSLQNQDHLLQQASNLSSVINTSSSNINHMFKEFNQSTSEQRQLINDIFDRISGLQSTIIGEFSWFYSVVYYVVAVIVCYIVTATPQTHNARLWLFFLMTTNALTEKSLIYIFTEYVKQIESDSIYSIQWFCRKLSAALGCLLLVYFACTFQDISVKNNCLLNDIRRQNEELRQLLEGRGKKKGQNNSISKTFSRCVNDDSGIGEQVVKTTETDSEFSEDDVNNIDLEADKGHYKKQSESSKGFVTNIPTVPEYKQAPIDTDDDDDSVSSFSTAMTGRSEVNKSSNANNHVPTEFRDLHNSTPFKDIAGNLLSWASSGSYIEPKTPTMDFSRKNDERKKTNVVKDTLRPLQEPRKYNLRQRKQTGPIKTPEIESESSRGFTGKVKKLEKVSARNSRLVKKKILFEDRLPISSEEDQ